MSNLRIGQGFDAHKIIKGSKDFILGGIAIDSEYEVVAHSDGDIISHAIIDALLGACKMGDIGKLAPSNEENRGISSIHLLKKVATMLLEAGYQIVNIDLTYVGEEPRLEKFKKKIEENKIYNLTPKRYVQRFNRRPQKLQKIDAISSSSNPIRFR